MQEHPVCRYEQIQVMVQQFWKRWSKEYISQLNQQQKRYKKERQLQVGVLALLGEDNVPPLQWILVRIHDVHSGQDGLIRVVTIRTSNRQLFKRSANQIYPLPIDPDTTGSDSTKSEV